MGLKPNRNRFLPGADQFGPWLWQKRERLDLSRTRLAAAAGVHSSYIRAVELQLKYPSLHWADRIARALKQLEEKCPT